MPVTFHQSPFQFIKTDIQKQREIAADLLEQAEAIQSLLNDPNLPNRTELEGVRNRLLLQAKALATNANITSSTATEVIADVSAKST